MYLLTTVYSMPLPSALFVPVHAMNVAQRNMMPFWCCSLTAVTVIAGLCCFFNRYRINGLVQQQAIRNRIAKDLHDHVGSTLSSIAVYSRVAKIYEQQGNSEKLQEMLGTIETTADETINEMSDIVWAINPLNDQMFRIIQKIKAFVQPLCLTKGIEFRFYEDAKVSKMILDMTARKNIFLILKEALNNAVKHSGCKTITLDMRVSRYYLQILITDDGKGFNTESPAAFANTGDGGNGLLNIHDRSKELGAQLKISSAPGHGTRIDLLYNLKTLTL